MLDIKDIRQNPEKYKTGFKNRNHEVDVDALLELDDRRKKCIFEADALKSEQNIVSKQIPAMKKEGKDTSELFAKMKEISGRIKELDGIIKVSEEELQAKLLSIPNIPLPEVIVGEDDSSNLEIRRWGEPRQFDFEALPHWEIGKALNILDPETAAKVTGARFHFYRGLGARLERAIISFFLDAHTENGYTELLPPYMVNRASMTGTGQLPKFEEDAFHLDGDDYFLIPTAEVPVTNYHRNEILSSSELPIKYCAYSACFRSEAGSAGRDTRGLIRQRQFNKVELVKFCEPEKSAEELESLTQDAERVLRMLELPYRVVMLCTGDLGFSSAKTYDIEVWLPSYGRYCEISSCSCFTDFQARRAAIRYKTSADDKAKFVHTLNGSGVAIGRTVAAILENYQNSDGSVTVPEVLRKYMGTDVIK